MLSCCRKTHLIFEQFYIILDGKTYYNKHNGYAIMMAACLSDSIQMNRCFTAVIVYNPEE